MVILGVPKVLFTVLYFLIFLSEVLSSSFFPSVPCYFSVFSGEWIHIIGTLNIQQGENGFFSFATCYIYIWKILASSAKFLMIWRLPQIWFSSVKTSKFSIDFAFCFSTSLTKREISSFLISYFISFPYNMIVLFLSETETLCSFNYLYIFLYLNSGCTYKGQTLYLWSHILTVSTFPFRVPFLPWETNTWSWYCHKSLA